MSSNSLACGPESETINLDWAFDVSDFIFVGTLIEYRPLIPASESSDQITSATLTFKVLGDSKELLNDEITVLWDDGWSTVPDSQTLFIEWYGKDFIVGVSKDGLADTLGYDAGQVAELQKSNPDNFPWISQGICTAPFLLSRSRDKALYWKAKRKKEGLN
jgi:hypothetical protein